MKIVGLLLFLISLYYLFNFLYFGRVGAFLGFTLLIVAHVLVTALISERPKKLWFKNKKYGWGWTPVSWEGWLVTAVFTILTVIIFLCADSLSHSVSDTLLTVFPYGALLFATLIAVCYKTGESPKWRWGN